jgi:ABC-type transporter Mla MlaB component
LAAPERSRTTQVRLLRPDGEPSTIVVAICGQIAPADIPELWERVRTLEDGCEAAHLVCDMRALVRPDAATVNALARLQLTARRFGRRISLRDARVELLELLVLMGLSDVVPCSPGLPLQPRWKAEEREQAGGVQEETDPGDLAG